MTLDIRFLVPIIVAAALGCGATPIQESVVEVPRAPGTELGAATKLTYSADVEPQRDRLRLTVYEESVCEKFEVQNADRYREQRRDGELISKEWIGPSQKVTKSLGEVSCGKTFARDVRVALRVGEEVVTLGSTDREGRIAVNLTQYLASDALGVVDAKGTLIVSASHTPESVEVQDISLDFLRANDDKVQALLTELGTILDKDQPSKADIRRSYEVYEQLRKVAWYDARFKGLAARFWELFFERKQQDAADAMSRNLKALEESKELLKTANLASIPVFAQLAINSASVNPRTVEWARSQVFSGLLATPKVCATGFSWGAMGSFGLSPELLIALNYLRFAFGDGFAPQITAICARL